MPKKASTHGASAPSKSKTARSKTSKAKSKDKAAPRKETHKAAPEAASKPTTAAAKQGGSSRGGRSRSLSPDDRPNIQFAYRDHSPGAESPVFDIPMITGSESDGDSPGSTKDPTSSQDTPSRDAPSQDVPAQDAPSQDAPVDDTVSSEAKAASTSSPAKNLTLAECKARAQAAKAASQKRADVGAAAAKKRAAPDSPSRESGFSKDYHSLFDSSSDEAEEEGTITEPQEISNDLDEQRKHYQAAHLQGASAVTSTAPPTLVYPRGYDPPYAGSGSPVAKWFCEIARSQESSCTLRPSRRLTEGVLRSSVKLLDLTLCTRRWD
ncbi:ABC Superfamily [Phytophthora palmivora]|uniref:ABC Superfamily n=1 Tax=Phytophthora palmivora TaxID=4796 RepID=A0A2P4XG58_9STRA|nr:ABC Superfamily [Phytophthora palmivora]